MKITAKEFIEMNRIGLKPISANIAFKGQRFKTDEYKRYERDLLFMLPKLTLPNSPYHITFEFGLSNNCADIDNPTKQTMDVMSKKYGFNDKHVYRLEITKLIVPKGKEYISFKIEHYEKEY